MALRKKKKRPSVERRKSPRYKGVSANPYINRPVNFHYFFIRKVMFLRYTSAVIVMPGGFGTMDEFFEVLTLVQTRKIDPFPIILVNKKFWQGGLDWIKKSLYDNQYI